VSDGELRALERAALFGGVTEQVRLIRKRVRIGEITNLKLAVYLGDEASRIVVGGQFWDPEGLGDLMRGLNSEAQRRASVAAARVALKTWEDLGGGCCNRCGWMCFCPRYTIRAAENWILDSNNRNLDLWNDAWLRLSRSVEWIPPPWSGHVWILAAARYTSVRDVRIAIQNELVSWALNRGDPLKERQDVRN